MRNTIARCLEKAIEKDRNLVILSADLGYSVFDHLRERFPDNFINVGIAENSMVGIAAGMAMAGRRVFVYSISKFLANKCFEQISEDVCAHNLPVTFIGVGSGFSYGFAGFSHYCINDIGVLRQIPNLEIYSPCDNSEVESIFNKIINKNSPAYIRLGKKEKCSIVDKKSIKTIAPVYYLKRGKGHVAIASYGTIMSEVLKADALLMKDGINVSIISCPTIKPIDINFFKSNITNRDKLFVVEEHYAAGGLGDALRQFNPVEIAITDEILHIAGTEEYMRQFSHIDAGSIVKVVKQSLKF